MDKQPVGSCDSEMTNESKGPYAMFSKVQWPADKTRIIADRQFM